MTDPARIFLSGGSGYVGRNVIRRLVASGHIVHAIVRSEESKKVVEGLGAKTFMADLTDVAGMTDAAEGCNYAVHCAAMIGFKPTLDEMRVVNVEGTRNFFSACVNARVPRVVHMSSIAVMFGEDGKGFDHITEETPIPEHPYYGSYIISKREAEAEAFSYSKDGMEVMAIRPGYIWGGDDTVALPQYVASTKAGLLKWSGNGDTQISPTHVSNVAEITEKAMLLGTPGQAYFCTDQGPHLTFKEYVTEYLLAVGVNPPTASVPVSLLWAVAAVAEKVSSDPVLTKGILVQLVNNTTTNCNLARKELGYIGEVTREAGLAELRAQYGTQVRPKETDPGTVEDCSKCKCAFSLFRKKHVCKGCGGIFCWACTNGTLLEVFSYDREKVRVCAPCCEKFVKK